MLFSNGSWTFSEEGYMVAKGNYSIHANEFTFETDSYCGTGATYTWTFRDDILLLKGKGKDMCHSRFDSINLIPYHKEQ